MTNEAFAGTNQEFREFCDEAGVAPSRRQASRWRMFKGMARKAAPAMAAKRKVDAMAERAAKAKEAARMAISQRGGGLTHRQTARSAITTLRMARLGVANAKEMHQAERITLRKQKGPQ